MYASDSHSHTHKHYSLVIASDRVHEIIIAFQYVNAIMLC